MDITFKCDKCGQHIEVDEAAVGMVVNCPSCAASLRVPNQSRPSVTTPVVSQPTSLQDCPDCGRQISKRATSCPHCGAPNTPTVARGISTQSTPLYSQGGMTCPRCGSHSVGKARGLQGIQEIFICVSLCFLFLIPGIIYYAYMESVPYCSGCGRRV